MGNTYKGLIFDLDGVLVDTAKYHYLAWKALAQRFGIHFTEGDNEKLKGVSRQASLEIILDIGGIVMDASQKKECCDEKNEMYLSYIRGLKKSEIFPGVHQFLEDARANGYKIALGSASQNARLILERLELTGLFDAVVDGNLISNAKPDPEVFIKGSTALGVVPTRCIVFEDSVAGLIAAHRGGMKAVGIGNEKLKAYGDMVIPGFEAVHIKDLVVML